MSIDRMVNVFPVVFDFKKGEQPDSKKLTKWVQLTDNAFDLVTRAIGDPWDYQSHIGDLSPQKLAQATIARIIGPSEYIGPLGETVNSPTTVTACLNRNGFSTWFLGFPFIKTTSSVGPDMHSGIELMDVEDIHIEGDYENWFATHHTDPRDLRNKGDYYINFAAGIIQTAVPLDPDTSGADPTITFNDLAYVGAGSPWSTHNVIPIWEEGSAKGIEIKETTAGPGNYQIDLPNHSGHLPRVGNATEAITGNGYSLQDDLTHEAYQVKYDTRPTEGTKYRLPYAIEEKFEETDAIPTGAILLWDNDHKVIVPLTDFEYVNAIQLKLTCPPLTDISTTSNDTRYRLIVVGTSLAEQVSYLSAVLRENLGQGLSYGGTASFPSISYSPPISHDMLRDRYSLTGAREKEWDNFVAAFQNWQTQFAFAESHVPTNPHPQYMHRAGWMNQDRYANSGNAMRGDLVFAGQDENFSVGGRLSSGNLYSSYGVVWGGRPNIENVSNSARLAFEGGYYQDSWDYTKGPALRFGFNLANAIKNEAQSIPAVPNINLGALSFTPWYGTPLYLRGGKNLEHPYSVTHSTTQINSGVLGFDWGRLGEANYIKLLPPIRATQVDIPNEPVKIDQDDNTALSITPNLNGTWKRLAASQIREFRFRATSCNFLAQNSDQSICDTPDHSSYKKETILNTEDDWAKDEDGLYVKQTLPTILPSLFRPGQKIKLSGWATNDGEYTIESVQTVQPASDVYIWIVCQDTSFNDEFAPPDSTVTIWPNEFNQYFVSPGMVGADFLNLYSNAIFFSDTGDGQRTSFTDRGLQWMKTNNPTHAPSGLYYSPKGLDGTSAPCFSFSTYDAIGDLTTTPLVVGDIDGFHYSSTTGGDISLATTDGNINLETTDGGYLELTSKDNNLNLLSLGSGTKINILASPASNAEVYIQGGYKTTINAGGSSFPRSSAEFTVSQIMLRNSSSTDNYSHLRLAGYASLIGRDGVLLGAADAAQGKVVLPVINSQSWPDNPQEGQLSIRSSSFGAFYVFGIYLDGGWRTILNTSP